MTTQTYKEQVADLLLPVARTLSAYPVFHNYSYRLVREKKEKKATKKPSPNLRTLYSLLVLLLLIG